MLGSCIAKILKEKHEVFLTGRQTESFDHKELDYQQKDLKDEDYDDLLAWSKPEFIVHCAAITDVAFCEKNPSEAFRINSHSVKKFVQNRHTDKFIFISSEAVYDGTPKSTERSITLPSTTYAKSKLEAEQYLKHIESIAIRTTIVGSKCRAPISGLVDWIINSLRNEEIIELYEDNIFSPITIWSLAQEIDYLIKNWMGGIWNISGKESISKYEFGYRLAGELGLNTKNIKKGRLSSKQTDVKRTIDQSMDCSKYEQSSGRAMPNLDDTILDIKDHLQYSQHHEPKNN